MQRVSYQEDYFGWLRENAQLIREGKFSEIDAENIAEELESMGKSEKRELSNRLTVLLLHLLKWRFQTAKRSKSWRNTIAVQRIDIQELLEDSPSLTAEIADKIGIAYEKAKLAAEVETGIEKRNFPENCPFTVEQILDESFLPED
jgi:HD-GYP domain-containing protein (c-di-GMP phosphodiesterase class II)